MPDGGKATGCSATKCVVDVGDEAGPELGRLFGGGVGKCRRRGGCEDGHKVGLGVAGEMESWDGCGSEEIGRGCCDNEDSC